LQQDSIDIRTEALEKVLFQLNETFKRGIERIGTRLSTLSISEIQSSGLESYQSYLEILFSFLNYQQQSGSKSGGNESGTLSRSDPLKLRRSALEFILQSLKERMLDYIDSQTSLRQEKRR
jgi:hypothetical protein